MVPEPMRRTETPGCSPSSHRHRLSTDPSVAGSTSEGTGGGGGYCIVPYLAASVSVRSTLPDVEQTF